MRAPACFAPLWLVLVSVPALAQSAPRTTTGVEAEWDIRPAVDRLTAQAARLKPLLEQLNLQEWVANGAPDTYVAQWKSAQVELQGVLTVAESFKRQPERLPLAIDTYFRLERVENKLGSLLDGVRTYQNPALADLIRSLIVENSTNRERLREYIGELANTKEKEFEVADREAQRCRGQLMKQPAPLAAPKPKKLP